MKAEIINMEVRIVCAKPIEKVTEAIEAHQEKDTIKNKINIGALTKNNIKTLEIIKCNSLVDNNKVKQKEIITIKKI